jgi:capsular polysaccharide biosynthesis protein
MFNVLVLILQINHTKDLVIFAFIGIVISVGFVLVLNMLDTTIKTEQDVENSTGLLVLSSIPNYEVENKRKKGGRR